MRAVGVRNRPTREPRQAGDHFRIGTVTTTMTAVTVLRLVEQDRLSSDDHLSSYAPGIANGSCITVWQLLGMTARVHDFSANPSFDMVSWLNLTLRWTPARCRGAARHRHA